YRGGFEVGIDARLSSSGDVSGVLSHGRAPTKDLVGTVGGLAAVSRWTAGPTAASRPAPQSP
ncbi:MAG TPA: hypothetical protein VFN75_11755, partial [Pseudonocardiaceae bacterium]|nr:hypothetical protein [Pseudonocardiaceae bacterium]